MQPPVVSIAPMVDVTHRHFRFLMRLMTRQTELYTPMLSARRLAARKRQRVDEMIAFHPAELPLTAQLGGDDPRDMLSAALKCERAGYSGVNINLGCPARTAQEGRFGVVLMRPPHAGVLGMLRELTSTLSVPVSCKVRIGIDDLDSYEFFRDFIGDLSTVGGCRRFIVHARKALVETLPQGGFVSTRQNRMDDLVPLRLDFAHRLKEDLPALHVEINGGFSTVADIRTQASLGMDGVMFGRRARDYPWFFASVDEAIFGDENAPVAASSLNKLESRLVIMERYARYASREQRDHGAGREMLLKPLNRMFEGHPAEKALFATSMRRREDPKMDFGDEVRFALEKLASHRSRESPEEMASQRGHSGADSFHRLKRKRKKRRRMARAMGR